MLLQGSHRFLGLKLPPLKHLGPLLVVWGGAMVMLVFIRDLGSSLMFFGGFLAILYVATNRVSFVAMGLGLFAIGAWFFANTVGHVQNRIDTWRDPFDRALYEKPGGSYQIAQSLFAQADGGLFGTGFGQALITQPGGGAILPGAADRPDLRGDHERARARGRLRAAARLPDGRRARVQDRDAGAATRSPSCWRPG